MSEVATPAPVNPWIVQPAKQVSCVPNGMYNASFKGVEEFKMPSDGATKWRFLWVILTGPEAGKIASALADPKITPDTLPGRLIAGLLGRPLVPEEDVKAAIDACVGKTYIVSIAPGPKGGKPGVRSCGSPPAM